MRTLAVLVLIFFVSVGIRWRLISNEINNYNHSEFFLLTTFENWDQRGIADCYFSPIQTFGNPGDKHVAYYKRLESKEGDNYFVSFPPFAFIFAYGTFKLLHIIPSKFAIELLNLFLHFISAVFIYLLVFRHYRRVDPFDLHLPSLAAFGVYLFTPIVLYLHTAIYFPETLGQVLWVIALYCTYNWYICPADDKRRWSFGLMAVIFTLAYTEWIAIFYVFTLWLVLRKEKNSASAERSFLNKGILISTFAGLLLTVLQYAAIGGWAALLRAFGIRFMERSGVFATSNSGDGLNYFTAESYLRIAHSLQGLLFPFGYLLMIFLAVIVYRNGWATVRSVLERNRFLIMLATLPAIIHLLVFFNGTAVHRHCMALLGPGLALLAGFVMHCISAKAGETTIRMRVVLFSVLAVSAIGCRLYVDRYYFVRTDCSFLAKAADEIRESAENDEAVFLAIKTDKDIPLYYISYMSKRNMIYARSIADAMHKLDSLQKPKAVYYKFDETMEWSTLFRFSRGEMPAH